MTKLRFDLQLFAANVQTTIETPPVAGDGPNGYANGLSPEMKTFYNTTLIKKAEPLLVYAQLGEKVSIPKNGGKSIEFRQFSPFAKALTPLEEGKTPDGVALNVTKITKELQQYGAYTTISDTLELTAVDNIIVETTELHANAMGRTLDTIVRNEVLADCTNVIYAKDDEGVRAESRADITAKHKITRGLVAEAAAFLKKMNAPKIDGSYWAVVDPEVECDLISDEEWIDVQKYGNATKIYEGEIGKLFGVRFLTTTESPTVDEGEDDATVHICMFFGKGAFKVIDVGGAGAQIIVKPKDAGGAENPLNQRGSIGWKIPLYGAKVVIPEYLVRVECGSEALA